MTSGLVLFLFFVSVSLVWAIVAFVFIHSYAFVLFIGLINLLVKQTLG